MSNELLDFTQRDNFDFLKFSSKVKDDDDKAILKQQCERVLEFAHATVQDMCLLGWHLKELKNSKTWQEVFDPKSGVCFHNFSFQDFCEYAFGFSKTRTSNLLSLSEFVKISGTKTSGFIEERFAGYNTSQLIELSSVPSGQTHYFSPDMTVKDIRLVKKYIASDGFWYDKQRDDFDLLTYAKNYAEQGQKKQEKEEITPSVLPGQMGIEIPTSELASDGDEVQDEVLTDEQREEIIKKCLIERAGEWRRGIIFEAYKTDNLSRTAFVEYIKDQYGSGGFRVGNLDVTYNYKGYHITYGANDIFLTWATVTSYIVSYINRGEYYTEPIHEEEYEPSEGEVWQGGGLDLDEDEENEEDESTAAYAPDEYDEEESEPAYIREAREKAHAAGLPFYEGDEEEFNPYVYDGKMSVEDYKLMHELRDGDKVMPDLLKEYDPCQLVKGMSPWVKPDFKNRNGIREFYRGFRNWEQVYSGVPFIEIYRYAFKLGTLYAVRGNIANILTSDDDERERTESVRYYWQEKGTDLRDAFETNKLDLEKFIPLHKDEL